MSKIAEKTNKNDELQRLAEEELVKEAKMAAARAETGGTYGWQKCPLLKTNKRFLRNTILHSLSSNSSTKMKVKKDNQKNKVKIPQLLLPKMKIMKHDKNCKTLTKIIGMYLGFF